MSPKPKILVTSAAGKTGYPTVMQLIDKGFPVRAFVHNIDARSRSLEAAGAEIFHGNQYALSDLRTAMRGVTRAYQCPPTAPNGLLFNAAFTVAAREARLEHVVIMSQWLSSVDHPSHFTREVYIGDSLIAMSPETTVTKIKVGWFADNYLMVLDMAAHLGMFTMPLGDGDEKKNAAPSNEDIASVIVGALCNPHEHAGKTYRPTGPRLMSPNEIAEAMGRALGRKVKYRNISETMMLKALKALPPSNYSDVMATQLKIYADEYRRGTFAINAPTNDVARVGNRDPETLESIVRRRVENQPELNRSLPRTLSAMAGFVKILLTRPPKPSSIALVKDFPEFAKPAFCQEDAEWPTAYRPALA